VRSPSFECRLGLDFGFVERGIDKSPPRLASFAAEKPRRAPKEPPMVFLSTLDHKSYWQELTAGLPEVRCPNPSCSRCLLRGHGWYRRYLGGRRVAFRRTRCPCCGVTHALLPEDVCAYQDLTLSALECRVPRNCVTVFSGCSVAVLCGSGCGVRRLLGTRGVATAHLRTARDPGRKETL